MELKDPYRVCRLPLLRERLILESLRFLVPEPQIPPQVEGTLVNTHVHQKLSYRTQRTIARSFVFGNQQNQDQKSDGWGFISIVEQKKCLSGSPIPIAPLS